MRSGEVTRTGAFEIAAAAATTTTASQSSTRLHFDTADTALKTVLTFEQLAVATDLLLQIGSQIRYFGIFTFNTTLAFEKTSEVIVVRRIQRSR